MRPTFVFASALWLTVGHPLPAAGQQSAVRPLDVVLVLDNSGSMKKNDPGALMRGAVSEFASQLPPAARLGIVIFDDNVDIALSLTASGEQDFQSRLEKSLDSVDYTGRWTDIAAGVERALYELRRAGRADAHRVVVFFTDGIVDVGDPARNLERAGWLRNDLAQSAKRLDIRIFGIAFTEAADFQLIQSVAQTTDGEYFRVLAAADLSSVFRQITDQISRPVVVAAPSALVAPERDTSRRWLWVGGAITLVLVAIWALGGRPRRSAGAKPSVVASLLDLSGQSGSEKRPLDRSVIRVGRVEANDIVIAQETVSSEHAVIEFRDGSFYLRDLRSANGTFVNGRKFSDQESMREVALKHRDRIRFDAYEFEFITDALEDAAQTRLAGDLTPAGTRMRAEIPAPIAQPAGPKPAPENLASNGRGDDQEAKTRLKPDMCPNHPAWKATELCSECKTAVCRNCMVDKGGQRLCTACARALAV